ncbi:MAG: alkaline phosphatase family protein [Candidatus Woesearchaeota archaeon]
MAEGKYSTYILEIIMVLALLAVILGARYAVIHSGASAGTNDGVKNAMIVIIIDGFSSSYLSQVPLIQNITADWASNYTALSVMPSITPSAYASMLTGVAPNVHGVMDYSTSNLSVPTIFQLLESSGIKTCFIAGKKYLQFLMEMADYSYAPAPQPNMSVSSIDAMSLSKAADWLQNGKCSLLIINLPATDLLGHEFGPVSKEMSAHLKYLDGLLSGFMRQNINSTMIITADHGMCANKAGGYHGTNESCAMTVPIFVSSNISGYEHPSSIKDVYGVLEKICGQ